MKQHVCGCDVFGWHERTCECESVSAGGLKRGTNKWTHMLGHWLTPMLGHWSTAAAAVVSAPPSAPAPNAAAAAAAAVTAGATPDTAGRFPSSPP